MRRICLLLLSLIAAMAVASQNSIRVMSYNVENLFDIKDDTLKDDIDFTPEGDYHWTSKRYKQKINNIARVIAAVGQWEGAAIVGLCEIENDYVLRSLTQYSPLKKRGYKYVHYESDDVRGVDVAMLYDPKVIKVAESHAIDVNYRKKGLLTRDILYAKCIVRGSDTLHVFVCHTPSRRGGVKESEWKRERVLGILRQKVDSINAVSASNVLIMGDFNDYPDCKSLSVTLGAEKPSGKVEPKGLYNLFWHYQEEGKGSYKYQGEWNMLDQIIVSGKMLGKSGLVTSPDKARIFEADFIMEDDTKNFGKKPYRTYNGPRYRGGYSDHLPVYVDLEFKHVAH